MMGEAPMHKIRLTQLEGEILRLLEEAGEETVACKQVTLKIGDDQALDSAITRLRHIGFILDSSLSGRPSVFLTEAGKIAVRC